MISIENWAQVQGQIEAVENSPVADHLAVTIVIDAVESVEDYPNRLHKEEGDDLTVHILSSAVATERFEAGSILSARVRRADLNRVYTHPDEVEIRPPSGH